MRYSETLTVTRLSTGSREPERCPRGGGQLTCWGTWLAPYSSARHGQVVQPWKQRHGCVRAARTGTTHNPGNRDTAVCERPEQGRRTTLETETRLCASGPNRDDAQPWKQRHGCVRAARTGTTHNPGNRDTAVCERPEQGRRTTLETETRLCASGPNRDDAQPWKQRHGCVQAARTGTTHNPGNRDTAVCERPEQGRRTTLETETRLCASGPNRDDAQPWKQRHGCVRAARTGTTHNPGNRDTAVCERPEQGRRTTLETETRLCASGPNRDDAQPWKQRHGCVRAARTGTTHNPGNRDTAVCERPEQGRRNRCYMLRVWTRRELMQKLIIIIKCLFCIKNLQQTVQTN